MPPAKVAPPKLETDPVPPPPPPPLDIAGVLMTPTEVSAMLKKAKEQLHDLLEAPPTYPVPFRIFLAFCLSALICPLAFGGSFIDMWIAGAGAFVLSVLQLCATKSALYANVFEYVYEHNAVPHPLTEL